jgi:hypothetical protein
VDNLTVYQAFPVAYGYVQGWPQNYDVSNRDATVTVRCVDLFGYLANVETPDAVTLIGNTVGMRHRWRLNDGDDQIRDSVGSRNGTVSPTGVERNATALTAFHDGSTYFDGTGSAQIPITFLAETSAYSVSYVFRTIDDDTDFHVLFSANTGGIALGLYLNIDAGQLRWNLGPDVVLNDEGFEDFPTGPENGSTHHVLFIRNGDTVDIWLDGSHVVDSLATGQGTAVSAAATKILIGGSAGGSYFTGWVADYIVFDGALDDTQAATLAEAYIDGFDGDSAAERIQRVLDAANYPGATDLEAGEPRCCADTLSGRALAILQTVDATEQGRFFIGPDGTPTLHTRDHNITATRSTVTQATFADDAAALATTGATQVPFLGPGPQLTQDIAQTINEVSVSSPALASTVTVTDDATQATFGVQSRSVTTYCRSNNDARSIGETIVGKYSTPETRAEAWAVAPERKPVVWPTVLGLKIGDRIVIERTPQAVGSQIQIPMYLERIEHRITPSEWTLVFSGIPAEPEASTSWWVLGTSQLNTSTTLYY